MAKIGDKVKISTDQDEMTGILMPEEKGSIIIKLDSGYNIGISKEKVKQIVVISTQKVKTQSDKPLPKKKGLKNIIILHTGGTIASKVDYETGGVTASFSAAELVTMVPELKEIANIDCDLVANMMSEDMRFSDYQKIIKSIKKYMDSVDGIIIGHGTDTIAYTAAAFSFVFENPTIPIILVGSQRSSDRGSSDAAMNLICAAEYIANTDYKGVALCMHGSTDDDECVILPGTKTRKLHSSRRDAFKAVNDTPLAIVDYKTRKIKKLKSWTNKQGNTTIKDKFSKDVGLLKTHPNMKPELFDFYTKTYKGIIIEATGLGQAPTNLGINEKNYETLSKFIKKGGIVGITTQTIFGRVHPFIYKNCRRLHEIGCIFCQDMLPETAYIKLSWLLGNFTDEEARILLPMNLRGEIKERLLDEDYDID
jgi:glutamyl-tRNA(Gln) amidotransferase subunit D